MVRLTLEERVWVETEARAAGFDVAGVAAVAEPESASSVEDKRRFEEWIASGRAGEMAWLSRADANGVMLRSGVRVAMPWARSVVVCAMNYNAAMPRSVDPAEVGAGWIARYAWSGVTGGGEMSAGGGGADYHDVMLEKLRVVEARLRERFGAALESRCYVDTGPIVERTFAEAAGVGWVGRNTCVLKEGMGSWLLLGVIVLSAEVETGAWAVPAADRCGSCTRCIEACPTHALVGERQMDASRCIAYLTIEKKGTIAEELREGMGRQVFGCDICQDVCPWNRKAPVAAEGVWPVRGELVNPELRMLAELDGAGFKRMFRGSPLERTGRRRLQRNVAIAIGNSGEEGFAEKLREWADGEDAVLAEAAEWGLGRLAISSGRAAVD